MLRPGGWLGCMWNDMVPTGDWQWEAVRLDPAIAASIESRSPWDRLGLWFGHAVQQKFRWTWMLVPSSGALMSRRCHTSARCPRMSVEPRLMRPNASLHRRVRRQAIRSCRLSTTPSVCVGTQSGRAPSSEAHTRLLVTHVLRWAWDWPAHVRSEG